MNRKLWIQKALTTCSLMALVLTYSMVTLATSARAAGELTVSGGGANATASVTVNGEPAQNGRTVFASSTITVPEGMTATLNFGKTGKIQFGPNTTFTLGADQDTISGDLTSGAVTVLSAAKSVDVKTMTGELVRLNPGETALAEAGKAADDDYRDSAGKCIDADKDGKEECGGTRWAWYFLVFGGAVVGILWVAMADNDSNFGGTTGTVSPTR